MDMNIYSATITLFLVMDPLGNIPIFLSVLKPYNHVKQRKIILREVLIAFVIISIFLFFGRFIMHGLGITEPALSMAGGIILFLIAINMIFPGMGNMAHQDPEYEPFVVPLAVPMTAGPSSIAVVMLFVSQNPGHIVAYFGSIVVAFIVFTSIMLASRYLMRILGERGLIAVERLMGMILTVVAVQMFLQGITDFLK
jgi:multiple antibiotic resistance protein